MMLSQDLPLPRFKTSLQLDGVATLPNFLEAEVAERIYQSLLRETPFALAYRADGQDLKAQPLTEQQEQQLLERCYQEAQTRGYGFAYDAYHLVSSYLAGDRRAPLLMQLLEWLNQPSYHQLMRELTNTSAIARIDAQATRYRRGHFLRKHNDFSNQEERLFAYVLNLSKDWRSDFGGLLQFTDNDDRVTRTLTPAFNTLMVFKVPQMHQVSLVAPYATVPRLAITGWMMR